MSLQPPGAGTDEGRCPSCGARVVHVQEWCTLCHTRLDAEGAEGAEGGHEAVPAEEPGLPGLPDAVAEQGTLPPGAAEAMLAELSAVTAAQRPFSSGPLARTGRGVRLGLAVAAAVVLAAVGVGLLTLVGLLV